MYNFTNSSIMYILCNYSKPLMYAYALQEIGKDKVHKYVGQEPSGEFCRLNLYTISKDSVMT